MAMVNIIVFFINKDGKMDGWMGTKRVLIQNKKLNQCGKTRALDGWVGG